MSDVSYRYAAKVLQDRRAIQNDETGEVTFVANEGSVPADVPVTEEEDEAFLAFANPALTGATEEYHALKAKPVKPVSKSVAKRLKATEGDK